MRLIDVFQFERFIEKAYLGQKIFTIEGLDVVVPMLDELVTLAHRSGAEEVVFGMAHRGRLSRPRPQPRPLGRVDPGRVRGLEADRRRSRPWPAIPHGGTGDVKYHYGHQGIYETSEGEKIAVRLYPNPSHLEFVNPVVEGATRFIQSDFEGAKIEHKPKRAVPVLLHGDAAFPGQGVVAETLNLQALRGYTTGGTIHVIQNNQVGFTTDPEDARSTPYAADMAKGFNVPIVHVNADDVEACSAAMRLAMAYRERWGRDIVIDVIGYRRYGHNETDEPAYTQPQIAAKIKAHPPVSEIYAEKLIEEGTISREEVEAAAKQRHDEMSAALKDLRHKMELGDYEDPTVTTTSTGELDRSASPPVETAVPIEKLRELNEALIEVPESFTIHRKLRKPLAQAARGAGERRDRIRPRRGARLRLAADRGRPHPPHRPGHRARHLLPPPPRPARREHRPRVLPDAEPRRRQRPLRALQQPALGDRLPRLRVRLLGGDAERAGPLGGPVRRLRQRRPGDHRQLHRLRRGQVGTDQPPHPAAAARLRGLRARSTPAPASSASSPSPPRATSASPTRPPRPSTSTCCAARR